MRKSAQTVIRPDAYYTIAAANGRVLEVADFNTENGASVRLWSYEGQPWQQWQFVEAGDGEYRIRNRFTGKVMDLAMSGVCNGTWVHQWTQTAGAGQRWQIVEAGGGKVKLTGLPPGQERQLRPLRLLRVGGLKQFVQRQPAQLLQKLQNLQHTRIGNLIAQIKITAFYAGQHRSLSIRNSSRHTKNNAVIIHLQIAVIGIGNIKRRLPFLYAHLQGCRKAVSHLCILKADIMQQSLTQTAGAGIEKIQRALPAACKRDNLCLRQLTASVNADIAKGKCRIMHIAPGICTCYSKYSRRYQ